MWVVVGSVVAEFAIHARDYIDFDAGRYERLAISIARTHSLAPRIDGANVHYFSQLYPILLAPFFVHGPMWRDLQNAGVASAYIMTSACIPAFLLTRRVTPLRWAPYVVAVLTVCMPWIITSIFLMTEVAAYPACIWAMYAMVVAISAPSRKHDLLAIVVMALAFFARGEMIVLAIVLPLALVAFELGRASGERSRDRLLNAGRSLVDGHLILVVGYLATGTTALVLYLQHRLSSVIGIYSVYSNAGHLVWGRLPRSLVEHLATFSLGVGVVPCVIALAWLGATVVRGSASRDAHAFACVGGFVTALILLQTTNFDLVVNAYVHDRFLMYLVPVMLIGAVLGISEAPKLRWSLVAPLVLIVSGFLFGEIPAVAWRQFVWLDLDTPISTVYRVLAFHLGGLGDVRGTLVVLAVAGTSLFVVFGRRLRTPTLALFAFGFCAVAMATTTFWVFDRTFTSLDRNERLITTSQHGTADWIDQAVGPNARVTAIQYPVTSDGGVNQKRWVDFEYFNRSIVRHARVAGQNPFDYTGLWFPALQLHFDAATGAVAESPTRWIVESLKETRFRIAGPARFQSQDSMLIDAGSHWRLAWRTYGLYDDGWTQPGIPMRMAIYAKPGQKTPRVRTVALVLRGPSSAPQRAIVLRTPGQLIHAVVTGSSATQFVRVCVPAHGYAELRLTAQGSSHIPDDLETQVPPAPRQGGVFIASLGEADEIGPACSVSATLAH